MTNYKDTLDEITERILRFNCPEGCYGNGSYPEMSADGEWDQGQCQWCFEYGMPAREAITRLIEDAERAAQIKGEIIGKKAAYTKAIMGAGEYHDDPYSYVVPIEHLHQYHAELEQFDLTEPIFRDTELSQPKKDKEKQ